MKGIVIHWESPWKDIFSGIDPDASAWKTLCDTYDLELHVVQCDWPFPALFGVRRYDSLSAFLGAHPTESIVLADYSADVIPSVSLSEIDYLVFGPASGWNPRPDGLATWTYGPSPNGGFHALFLGHIAAHMNHVGG